MRLSSKEAEIIVRTIRDLDPVAKIYLFGSRIKPQMEGIDIDLLVLSDSLGFSEKVSLLIKIKGQLGDQKIDLLIKPSQSASKDPFVKSILDSAFELNC